MQAVVIPSIIGLVLLIVWVRMTTRTVYALENIAKSVSSIQEKMNSSEGNEIKG